MDIRHQGKRLRMRCPGTTRADAQAYETYLRGELAKHGTLDHLEQSGRPATASVPTVGEFVGRFLAEYVDANNGVWERHTKRRILSTVLLPAFRDTPLDRIRSSDVERFKAASVGAGRSAKTINNHLSVLRTMLAMAVEWEIIPALPRIRFMKLPEMRPDFLSDMEVETLLAHANPTMRLMVRCAVDTGVREGELTALQWRDVNLERGTLTIQRAWARKTLKPPKNARPRTVPIPTVLLEDLRASASRCRPTPTDWIFSIDGRPICYATASWRLHSLCTMSGVRRVGWHIFRHTYASRLVSRGIPLKVVQVLLGHQSITMTMRYSHLAPDAGFDAAREALSRPVAGAVTIWSPVHIMTPRPTETPLNRAAS